MKTKTTADGQKLTPEKIKGFRESYREYRMGCRCDISDDGEGYLMGAVHATSKCGCRITGNGTIQFPLTIVPCKKHKSTK